jgi:3D (Asp-Asp-Asp) domain-containing protein
MLSVADKAELRTKVQMLETENDGLKKNIDWLNEQVVKKYIDPVTEEKLTSLGDFKITWYSPDDEGVSDTTYTGTKVRDGVIAVDPDVIPLGSIVVIDGKHYSAEDIGGAIKGKHIDIFVDERESALANGVQTKEVFLQNGN